MDWRCRIILRYNKVGLMKTLTIETGGLDESSPCKYEIASSLRLQ